MSLWLLSPKVDFVFKNIFGSEKHPKILISFLNAVMKPKDLIKSVEIKNSDIEKGIRNIAKNLLDILDDETIAVKTRLSIEEVKELRDNNY